MSEFYTDFFLRGKNMFLRSVVNGVKQMSKVPIAPTLYLEDSKNADRAIHRDIFGKPLTPVDFESPYDAQEFIKQNEFVEGFTICGFNRYEYAKINKMFPGEVQYNLAHIHIGVVDIETEIGEFFATANNPSQPINAISFTTDGENIQSWSLYDVDPKNKGTTHEYCKTEAILLKKFIAAWKRAELDIISGWNSSGFDLPYTVKRIELVLGEEYAKDLSPWGMYEFYDEKTKYGAMQKRVRIFGIADLDLLELYRKFVPKKQESYKLDDIAFSDLGEKKVEYEGSLKDLYTNDPEKFVVYNQQDVRLVWCINEKRKLIENAILIAYIAKVNYEDAFSTSRPWDVLIGNYLSDQNIHVPISSGGSKNEKYEGAFVKDPILGYHKWVMAFDLRSLYPSLMMQYNISPEKLLAKRFPIRPDDIRLKTAPFLEALQYAKDHNATLTANGTLYSKEGKGFIPYLVGDMFDRRKAAKDEQLEWEALGQRAKAILAERKKA